MDAHPSQNTTTQSCIPLGEGKVTLVADIYNVQGICDYKIREKTFNWLKSKRNIDISILTETKCHLPNKHREKFKKEWSPNDPDHDSFWSLGTQNSKGVTILIHDKFKNRGKK